MSNVNAVTEPTTISYALLGLLAIRSFTGYELTQQYSRSLRYVWPMSEGHIYREQTRLVGRGWATVEEERVGRRTRKRYSITPAGRRALRQWLSTEPSPPGLDIEGALRLHFADHGDRKAAVAALRATADHARAGVEQMLDMVEDYLKTGGPFPERLHIIALGADGISRLLGAIEAFFEEAADEVETWPTTRNLGLTDAARRRLEAILERGARR